MKRNPLIRVFSLSLLALVLSCGDDDPASPDSGPAPLSFINFQDAAVVIGQPDKFSDGSGTTATSLSSPSSPGGGSLYLPDQVNHRILGFDGIPTSDGEAATFVLGQPDFVTNTAGLTAQKFDRPTDCTVAGGKLFVADLGNNRVLIWNTLPTSDVPCDVVVGQADFTSEVDGLTQSGLNFPIRVAVVNGRLFVADYGHNRVMIWNTIPTTDGAPADVVVGQTNFTTETIGLTSSKFGSPDAMWTDGARLVIGDTQNSRVLIWNSIPAANGAAANVVVGAPDFTTQGSISANAASIGDPAGVASDGTSLFVSDLGFNRVLIYTPIPTSNGAVASRVLGQGNFTNSEPNDADQNGVDDGAPAAGTMDSPNNLKVRGTRLLVADDDNNRILIFNSY